MALLATNNITLTSGAPTSTDTILTSGQGQGAILDGIQFQMILASSGANPATFNFILNELYTPTNTNFNKWSINYPQPANANSYSLLYGWFPFGNNGLVFGTSSTLTLQGTIGSSSTAAYHFVYYLFGDYI